MAILLLHQMVYGLEKGALLLYLVLVLIFLLYSFVKSIKVLHKIELIEDEREVRISLFHYGRLLSTVCKREDFKLNIRQDIGGRSRSIEVQIFVNKELYFTQKEFGIWAGKKIKSIVYTAQDRKYKY